MIWTAWKNGKHNHTGLGYGFRVVPNDRDRNFRRDWDTVLLDLTGSANVIEVSISNASFWGVCCELRSKEIGRWLRRERHAPWPNKRPPRFEVECRGERRFSVRIKTTSA